MKKLLLLFILIFQHSHCQKYINIGSTKEQVKKLQGEPTSIETYEEIGKEIWRYGESGIATITFKNGEISGFKNHNYILKIGDNSKKKKSADKLSQKDAFWEKARDSNNKYEPENSDVFGQDKSGLYGSSTQTDAISSNKSKEMADVEELSSYEFPNKNNLQEIQNVHKNDMHLKWGLIISAILIVLFLITKYSKKNKTI